MVPTSSELSPVYLRNIEALRLSQPVVAALIDEHPIPPGVQTATGRDGRPTFLVPAADGRLAWLGGSSMPGVSSEELFGGWQWNGGNVVLPGILSGLEPLTIARRLPGHAAVFVVEPDALSMKLALHLYDYAPPVANGRTLLFLESTLDEQLLSFFGERPGYEMPRQILACPSRRPSEIAELQSRLERMAGQVLQLQVRAMEKSAAAIRQSTKTRTSARGGGLALYGSPSKGSLPKGRATTSKSPVADLPARRVAVLSTIVGEASRDAAAKVTRGLQALGWFHTVCIPDHPARVHTAARLAAVEHTGPNWVLFLESGPGELRKLLPVDLPVVSWLTHAGPVDRARFGDTGPRDLVIAETAKVCADLLEAGLPREQVHQLPPAARVFTPDAVDPLGDCAATDQCPRAVVISDLPDDRPEAADVRLPSHVALWKALQEVSAKRADSLREGTLDSLLWEAQEQSGVRITEPAIRDVFRECLRARIAPTAVVRHTLGELVRGCFDVAVVGRGWVGRLPQGVRNDGELRGPALKSAAATWVILPLVSQQRMEIALDALAHGARVAMRAGPVPIAEEHPDLRDVRAYIGIYTTTGQLLKMLSEPLSSARAAEAAQLVRAMHSVPARLMAIDELIRNIGSSRTANSSGLTPDAAAHRMLADSQPNRSQERVGHS